MMKSNTFSKQLLAWHKHHGRKDLPWQKNRTPYRVWLAEIMLQQTQVSTVIPYFQQFTANFPNLSTLARTDLEQVLSLWSGLGYYRRARYLHQCARTITDQYHGRFPRHLHTLMKLPGIGRSTAGAIMALAWGKPYPILDGNVKRVLCRYYSIEGWPGEKQTENKLWDLSQQNTQAATDVARYTQSIMDLGATVCRRATPQCDHCPLQAHCQAKQKGIAQALPTRRRKKPIPQKKTRMLVLYNHRNEVLLLKRPAVGVWPNLWSLPECDSRQHSTRWCQQKLGQKIEQWHNWPTFQHTFTHFKLQIQPMAAKIQKIQPMVMATDEYQWIDVGKKRNLAVAAPIKRLLQQFSLWIADSPNRT